MQQHCRVDRAPPALPLFQHGGNELRSITFLSLTGYELRSITFLSLTGYELRSITFLSLTGYELRSIIFISLTGFLACIPPRLRARLQSPGSEAGP